MIFNLHALRLILTEYKIMNELNSIHCLFNLISNNTNILSNSYSDNYNIFQIQWFYVYMVFNLTDYEYCPEI